MNFWESIKVALDGIAANKLRAFLTTLGIMIGIAAVIAVVAVGQGGRALLIQEMEKIGTNIFAVYIDWRSDEVRTGREFSLEDVTVIKEAAPEVAYLAPESSAFVHARQQDMTRGVNVVGTTADYAAIRNVSMAKGRFLTEADSRSRRLVAVLDGALARDFFGRKDPLGEKIVIRGTPLVVIGVAAEGGSLLQMGDTQNVYIPIKTWQGLFPGGFIHSMEGKALGREHVDRAMNKTVGILERRHDAQGRYASISMEQEMATANRMTGIVTLIIGAIAGISLFVGGIGVMNIMLVSVTERVREIGLRKALGARRKDILVQFLIEAVVLCILGGIIGMVVGIGGAFIIAFIAKWPPLVSWWTAVVAFLFSTMVGLVFGILPARKAAALDPVEALRRE